MLHRLLCKQALPINKTETETETETLKRSEREDGKALEKVVDGVVAKSLENSRTNRCINLMGLFFFSVFVFFF